MKNNLLLSEMSLRSHLISTLFLFVEFVNFFFSFLFSSSKFFWSLEDLETGIKTIFTGNKIRF